MMGAPELYLLATLGEPKAISQFLNFKEIIFEL